MWLFFGAIAIVTALLGIVWAIKRKDAKWFRFVSLAFTALTLCAFYSANAHWVIKGDWSTLEDVSPVLSKCLWICTFASIMMNSVSMFRSPKQ